MSSEAQDSPTTRTTCRILILLFIVISVQANTYGRKEIHPYVLQNIGLCPTGHWPFWAAALLSHHFFSWSLWAGHRVPLTMCNPWMTLYWWLTFSWKYSVLLWDVWRIWHMIDFCFNVFVCHSIASSINICQRRKSSGKVRGKVEEEEAEMKMKWVGAQR